MDVGFWQQGKLTQAAIALFSFPELDLVESAISIIPTSFPYIPGFLSFREIPAILKALSVLTRFPDLFFCDGHGIAHPRRCGIACHLGVLCDRPSIGVAKSLLIGHHGDVSPEKGAWTPLIEQNETIGVVLRTRSQVKPLYISVGHRISLETSIKLVRQCTTQYRLPETTRIADKLASMRGVK